MSKLRVLDLFSGIAYPSQTQRRPIVEQRDMARQHCLLAERAEDASRASEFPEAAVRFHGEFARAA